MLKLLLILLLLSGPSIACLAIKKKDIKKGWSFVPCPNFSYNSDLGLQYGAFCDIYNYGNGELYPNYYHKFSVEATFTNTGAGIYRLFYDSKYLIPNSRLTIDGGYLSDKMFDFYGFNGYNSPYFDNKNKTFYKMNRDMFRLTIDFQRKIRGNWIWATGISYYNYKMGEVKIKKYQNENNLYQLYINNGIINKNEARGGNIIQLKAGGVYNSRDIESDPQKGIWSEAILSASPDIIDRNGYHYLKFSFVYRQYVPIWKNKLTFAYRIGYQGTIAGKVPYYVQSNINTLYMRQTYSEGLGGTFSIRGVLRNRAVGDGIAWTNTEFRYRFLECQFLKQHWYFVINPLLDAGMVVTPYRKKQLENSALNELYSGEKERPHISAGIGAKIIMNHNFVLSVEWGKAFDKRDGVNGLNLYMNFLF